MFWKWAEDRYPLTYDRENFVKELWLVMAACRVLRNERSRMSWAW